MFTSSRPQSSAPVPRAYPRLPFLTMRANWIVQERGLSSLRDWPQFQITHRHDEAQNSNSRSGGFTRPKFDDAVLSRVVSCRDANLFDDRSFYFEFAAAYIP